MRRVLWVTLKYSMILKYTEWHDILISQDVFWTKSLKLSYVTHIRPIPLAFLCNKLLNVTLCLKVGLLILYFSCVCLFFSHTIIWKHLVKQYIDNSEAKNLILDSVNEKHLIVVLCASYFFYSSLFIFIKIQYLTRWHVETESESDHSDSFKLIKNQNSIEIPNQHPAP